MNEQIISEQLATDKAQGLDLMKAGLNITTADCYLHQSEYGSGLSPNYEVSFIQPWMNRKKLFTSGYQNIVSWSLTRLLQLMPDKIDGYQFFLTRNATGWQTGYVCEAKTDGNRYLHRYFGEDVFEVVIRLLKALIANNQIYDKYIYHPQPAEPSRPTFGDAFRNVR